MKEIHGVDIPNMFYQYSKYNPSENVMIDKNRYQDKLDMFMEGLNELESKFGFSIVSDYSLDYDGMIESQLLLYDNVYGCIGEIFEEESDVL